MVSRSNREARLNHSGKTIATGHGGLKRNAMGSGAGIKPKNPEDEGKYQKQAMAKTKAPKTSAAAKKEEEESKQGRSGWDKIGDAGESMVKTYKANKKAKESA